MLKGHLHWDDMLQKRRIRANWLKNFPGKVALVMKMTLPPLLNCDSTESYRANWQKNVPGKVASRKPCHHSLIVMYHRSVAMQNIFRVAKWPDKFLLFFSAKWSIWTNEAFATNEDSSSRRFISCNPLCFYIKVSFDTESERSNIHCKG